MQDNRHMTPAYRKRLKQSYQSLNNPHIENDEDSQEKFHDDRKRNLERFFNDNNIGQGPDFMKNFEGENFMKPRHETYFEDDNLGRGNEEEEYSGMCSPCPAYILDKVSCLFTFCKLSAVCLQFVS